MQRWEKLNNGGGITSVNDFGIFSHFPPILSENSPQFYYIFAIFANRNDI